MALFDNGVERYAKSKVTAYVYFPIDSKGEVHACCNMCRFYHRNTNRCMLNNQPGSYEPNKFVGAECPLQLIEETEGETQK